MTTSKTVKYVMTNGLFVNHDAFKRPILAKVVFAIQDDDTVKVTVESARNCSTIDKLGKKTITIEQLRDMPEDAYNNMAFNRAAFAMFGISV